MFRTRFIGGWRAGEVLETEGQPPFVIRAQSPGDWDYLLAFNKDRTQPSARFIYVEQNQARHHDVVHDENVLPAVYRMWVEQGEIDLWEEISRILKNARRLGPDRHIAETRSLVKLANEAELPLRDTAENRQLLAQLETLGPQVRLLDPGTKPLIDHLTAVIEVITSP